MGLNLGKNLFGKKLLAGLLGGPLGLLVVSVASVFDIGAMRQKVVDAGQQVLAQSYAQTSERVLGREHFAPIHEAIIAGLEGQLALDRRATEDILENFVKDMLIQASSPGFGDFIAGRSVADGKRVLKRVTAVFGRELADIAFWRKHQLVTDLEDEGAARAMVQRHGQAFIELHQSNREALKLVMRNSRYPEMLAHILSEADQADGLLFYARSLERFDGLSPAESEALILVRRLHPERSPETLQRDMLTLLGEVADRLRLVASQDEATAATVVDWVISGHMDGGLLRRLARHNDAAALLSLPVALGTEQFWKVLKAGDENSIVRFLRAFDRAKAVDLLRADPGYLAAFASAEGGGERAVRVRERLMQQYGPPLSPRTDATMHWLLARTGLPEQRITKAAIERLTAFGIPGLWPAILAVPAAGIVARPELLAMATLLTVMLLVGGISLLGGKWRLLRGLWRRRLAARDQTLAANAPEKAGDGPPEARYRPVQGGLELRR
jgi:hypothetical protein